MAQKISSGSMVFMKRVFPIIWFGFLVVFVSVAAVSALGAGAGLSSLFFMVIPVFVAFVGYTVMKQFIWDLVDEVYDHGDYLVVKNRGEDTRIELADIMNVSVSTMNPPRITLRLRQPTKLGSAVSFSPVKSFRWYPSFNTSNEVAEDLIVRVDRARSRRTG